MNLIARILSETLPCLFLPVSTLAYLAGGPQPWPAALAWTLPVWLCIAADGISPACREDAIGDLPNWLYEARLYALFTLQLVNIGLMLILAGRLHWNTAADIANAAANIAAMRILVGTTSCCSGIAVAHELIHRRAPHRRWMGRILLLTVCYDHFAIAHRQGHHRNVATPADPATAHFGESLRDFWRRSAKGQFSQAMALEDARLAAQPPPLRWVRHRILRGLLIEALMLAAILRYLGPVPLLMFLYQALAAIRMLESVNYFQHWGLTRSQRRFSATDAWITDSWFSLHAFVGLSRHANHHSCAHKPGHRLRHWQDSPRMPYGYFVMAIMVKWFNRRYRRLASAELKRKGLGPFRC